jgi:uncharacterized protein
VLGAIQQGIKEFLTVEISTDKMQASLIINEPSDEILKTLSSTKIINILDNSGVKSGLKRDVIEKIISEKQWGKSFIVAEGTAPTEGTPAEVAFYFETDISLKPKIGENGLVDYKEVCMVKSVGKNVVLLQKIPPGFGIPGRDVEGNELAAPKGKDVTINAGKGTYWDPDNEFILRAAIEGIISYNHRNHTVEVQQIFLVPGSVDYSTGNINVRSIVEIKGDVKPGFKVISPFNIFIKGIVENAVIACGGCLQVGSGIIGNDAETMNIAGNLQAGYIHHQHVVCEGNVIVNSEIRKSKIECYKDVTIVKPEGVIIGGSVTAGRKITSAYIGNSYGLATHLTVGINSEVGESLFKCIEEKEEMDATLKKLLDQITSVAMRSPETVFDSRLSMFEKQWNALSAKCDQLKKEISELEAKYYNIDDPSIEVTKKVYPGTVIKIKKYTREIKEELSHVKFVLVEDQIVCKDL